MSSSQSYLQDQEIKRIQYSIAIVTIIMSCFAIFLTVIFFIFNIRYRNFRLIKMSSPNINNIINFNCIMLYICPILNSIKGMYITNELLANLMCQINAWIIPLASTAIYAAMLAKAWRIYKIFETTPKAKKIVIKDLRLVAYICGLIAFDALIVTAWYLVDTIKLKPRYVYEVQSQPTQVILPSSYFTKSTEATSSAALVDHSSRRNASSLDLFSSSSSSSLSSLYFTSSSTSSSTTSDPIAEVVDTLSGGGGGSISLPIVQNYSQKNQLKLVFECNSNYNEVWITILTMYKIILLMYGIYLAWIIRNINVPSMNDSKYLLLSTYTIIVCGLGSMTLMQLLSNWPDVVQAFFTIGIILSTCTTQCLLFIPKIRLWYKRKNDDNFKISLSQIFLHASSNCYYPDKQSRNSNIASAANMLNIEEELCELLHENSQLKNYLKEKEEVIKLLQEKIRMAKAKLIQVTSGCNIETQNNKSLLVNVNSKQQVDGPTEVTTYEIYAKANTNNNKSNSGGESSSSSSSKNTAYYNLSTTIGGHHYHHTHHNNVDQGKNSALPGSLGTGLNNLDSGFDVDSSTCTATTTTETLRTSSGENQQQANKNQPSYHSNKQLFATMQQTTTNTSNNINTEQLKNDLDEVEELTTRVRDSISVDLSNTRRYSPLLYEYYRKQLELAKSIQSTYNIQCNTLFDAMTLMRKCLKDYCHTVVHNPEYLAIDAIAGSSSTGVHSSGAGSHVNHHAEYTYNDFLSENNLALNTNNNSVSKTALNGGSGQQIGATGLPFTKQVLLNSSRLKPSMNIVETPVSSSSGSTSFASTCSISTSSLNKPPPSSTINNLFNNNNYESTNLETSPPTASSDSTATTTATAQTAKGKISAIDNKQTYV